MIRGVFSQSNTSACTMNAYSMTIVNVEARQRIAVHIAASPFHKADSTSLRVWKYSQNNNIFMDHNI